jgi:acyl carrier protein
MDIMKELEALVSEYKGEPVTLTPTTTFDDLGFDSLDTVDLMMQFEEKMGITFDDDLQIGTLGELVAKIGELKK